VEVYEDYRSRSRESRVERVRRNKMKIRTGFVSNSSSSSFVCDVCGRQESGWDASLSDFDMHECEICNGVFCDSEMVKNVSDKDIKQSLIENFEAEREKHPNWTWLSDDIQKIRNTPADELDYGDFGDGLAPSVLCPMCQGTAYSPQEAYKALKALHKLSEQEIIDIVKAYRLASADQD